VTEPSSLRFSTQESCAGGIGGDVLDVSEVNAVMPVRCDSESRRPGATQHRLGLGIHFVVGKEGLDQQLFTNDRPEYGSPRRFRAGRRLRTGDQSGLDNRESIWERERER